VTVQFNAIKLRLKPFQQSVAKSSHSICFYLPLFPCQVSSPAETDDTRKVESARSDSALVAASMHLGQKPHPRLALPNEKGADSLGTIDLMSRQRKEVNSHCLDIQIQVTDRLSSISVKKHLAFVSDATDISDCGDCTNLVVRRHH